MKKPSQPQQLSALDRSGPPVVFALAMAAQGAGVVVLIVATDGHGQGPWLVGLSGLGLALTALAAVIALVSVNRSREQAARTQGLLDEAIEALPASVEIFDADDHIVAYNQRLVDIYPHMLTHFKRRASFEELLRASQVSHRGLRVSRVPPTDREI